MSDVAKYVYFAIILLAVPVWIAAVWNYVKMLGHARFGNIWAVMFNPLWWRRKQGERLLTPDGMTYHRRAVWLTAGFLAMVVAGIILTLANVVL